jgi:hypothetical protein
MRTFNVVVLGMMLGSLGSAVVAQGFAEADRITMLELDPATNDAANLGTSLAVTDSGFVFVGAPFREGNGSAHVLALGADGTLSLVADLLPLEPTFNFGIRIAADGEWAAIAERGENVRIYHLNDGNWELTQIIGIDDVPVSAGIDVRGISDALAMAGDVLVMGDQSANILVDGVSIGSAGAAVVFRRRQTSSIWAYEATLASPDPENSNGFGKQLAVSGDTLLVGSDFDRIDGVNAGRAWIFEHDAGTWAATAALENPQGEGEVGFGWSVAVSQHIAIVGCRGCNQDPGGPTNAGSFHVFERDLGGDNAWGLQGEYASATPGFIDEFSASLRLRGSVLAVGASGAGHAYFFSRLADGSWQEEDRLEISGDGNHRFGAQVDFVGSRAVIGAPGFPDDQDSARYGAIYSFRNAGLDACGDFQRFFCDGFEAAMP